MSGIYTEIARELERREFASLPAVSNHTFSDNFTRKMELLITSFNRSKRSSAKKKSLVLIAAIIISLVFGALCACAVYKKYFHYITDCGIGSFIRFDYDDYYDGYADSTAPSYLETYYAPTYIPDGYIIEETNKTEITYSIEYSYKSEDTHYSLHYNQCLLSTHFMVDTEDADVSYIKRNGIKYLCVVKNDTVYLSWTDNSYAFSLCVFGFLDKDEALKIAESIAAQ